MSEETRDMLGALNARLDRIEALTLLSAKSVLSLDEAVLYTGLSKGHLYRLTSERSIPHFKQSRKLYFSKSALDEWMQSHPVPTREEIESRAATWVATHSKKARV